MALVADHARLLEAVDAAGRRQDVALHAGGLGEPAHAHARIVVDLVGRAAGTARRYGSLEIATRSMTASTPAKCSAARAGGCRLATSSSARARASSSRPKKKRSSARTSCPGRAASAPAWCRCSRRRRSRGRAPWECPPGLVNDRGMAEHQPAGRGTRAAAAVLVGQHGWLPGSARRSPRSGSSQRTPRSWFGA